MSLLNYLQTKFAEIKKPGSQKNAQKHNPKCGKSDSKYNSFLKQKQMSPHPHCLFTFCHAVCRSDKVHTAKILSMVTSQIEIHLSLMFLNVRSRQAEMYYFCTFNRHCDLENLVNVTKIFCPYFLKQTKGNMQYFKSCCDLEN